MTKAPEQQQRGGAGGHPQLQQHGGRGPVHSPHRLGDEGEALELQQAEAVVHVPQCRTPEDRNLNLSLSELLGAGGAIGTNSGRTGRPFERVDSYFHQIFGLVVPYCAASI